MFIFMIFSLELKHRLTVNNCVLASRCISTEVRMAHSMGWRWHEHWWYERMKGWVPGTGYYQIYIYIERENNAWVTMNNDFLVTSDVICQWFSRVTKSQVKIMDKSPHEWPKKSLFMVTNVLFYFLYAILYLEHTIPLQTIIARSFRHWP